MTIRALAGESSSQRLCGRLLSAVMSAVVLVMCFVAVPQAALAAPCTLYLYHLDASAFPLVKCQVSAADPTGVSLQGLSNDEFAVHENGAVGTIVHSEPLRPEQQQLGVLLAIDRSGSMKGASLAAAQASTLDFVRRLGADDQYAVVAFASRPKQLLDFTSDKTAGVSAVNDLRAAGDTALYDTVAEAARIVSEHTSDQKAIVILTDGEDTASGCSFTEALSLARARGVEVHVIGLGRRVNKPLLTRLTAETGGSCFFTNTPSDLVDIYRSILKHINTRYEVTYRSPIDATIPVLREVHLCVSYRGHDACAAGRYAVPSGLVGGDSTSDSGKRLLLLLVVLLVINLSLASVLLIRRKKMN